MRGRKNWKCPCNCGKNCMDYELHMMIGYVERYFNKEISIHSGARCAKYNATLPGASDTSQHVECKGIDFHILGIKNEDIYNLLSDFNPLRFGVILYKWGIHFDVRDTPYRLIKN